MLRSRGVDTEVAAVAMAERDGGRDSPRAASVLPAPMLVFERTARSLMAASEITVAGTCWRLFMFGKRSVPPATYMPAGPASTFHFRASASVAGARYLNVGSRSMRLRP